MLPTKSTAVNDWNSWTQKVLSLGVDHPIEGVRMYDLTLPAKKQMTHEEYSRYRYRAKPLNLFSKLSFWRSLMFSCWWRILPYTLRRIMWHKLLPSRIFELYFTEKDERLLFSELGDIALKTQTLIFGEHWMQYVHLHSMTDYVPIDISAMGEAVKVWVTGKPIHSLGGEDNFYRLFDLGLEQFFLKAQATEPHPITIDEFLSDPAYYSRPGTSDGPRLYMKSAGKTVKARKSKWATFIGSTKRSMLNIFLSTTLQRARVIAKRERGKVRPIITADNANYLRESFISRWIEPMLSKHPNTPLFYGSTGMQQMYYETMADTLRPEGVNTPIDETTFDQMVTTRMIMLVLLHLRLFINTRCGWPNKAELVMAIDLIINTTSAGHVVQLDGSVLQYSNGVLSGWRWTALLNTIINASKVYAYKIYFEEKGVDTLITKFKSFGDDVDPVCPDYLRSVALFSCYEISGFKVNAKKSFVSPIEPGMPKTDEFLRQVSIKGELHGYPARAVGALITRNPVSTAMAPGEERVTEMASTWNVVISRAGVTGQAVAMMVEDIAKANKLTKSEVESILHTPAYSGGLGVLPFTLTPLSLKSRPQRVLWDFTAMPPLAEGFGQYALEAAALWKGNVQPGPHVEKEFFPVTKNLSHTYYMPYTQLDLPGAPTPNWTRPFPLPDVRPTLTMIKTKLVSDCNASQLTELVYDWLSAPSLQVYELLMRKGNLKITKMWLTDRLPFRVPLVIGRASVQVSEAYNLIVQRLWYWLLSRNKITRDKIYRIAATAEDMVHKLLNQLPLQTG